LQLAGLCADIAKGLGPEREVVGYETLHCWLESKGDDIRSLRRLFERVQFGTGMELAESL
jgi:hypothetical protein